MALGVETGNVTTVLSVPLRLYDSKISNKEVVDHLRYLARKIETSVGEGGIKEIRLSYDNQYRSPYLEIVVFNNCYKNRDDF
jgi:hypothetical protein